MSLDFTIHKPKRHVREIPLAPILDLLVVVIFFLILSANFIDFNKQTLPPSSVSVIKDPIAPPPISVKMFVVNKNSQYRMFLRWSGKKPDQISENIPVTQDLKVDSKALREKASEIIKKFQEKFPDEKSVQLGLGSTINYQQMVSVMDGVKESIPDLILLSFRETEAIDRGTRAD